MESAAELAGFFAAHGIWCVSSGDPLVPMVGRESAASGRSLERFSDERLEEGVAKARERLEANPDAAERAVLVYDGYITLPTGRTDALFLVVRSFSNPSATLTMAVPYRNANNGFAVHRLKFIDWAGEGDLDAETLGNAFFRGVDSHGEGAAVWDQVYDDSV